MEVLNPQLSLGSTLGGSHSYLFLVAGFLSFLQQPEKELKHLTKLSEVSNQPPQNKKSEP